MPDNVPEHKEVLIVDDQPANLTVLRKMLTEEGLWSGRPLTGRSP